MRKRSNSFVFAFLFAAGLLFAAGPALAQDHGHSDGHDDDQQHGQTEEHGQDHGQDAAHVDTHDAEHGDAHGDEHGDDHGGHSTTPHLTNWVGLVSQLLTSDDHEPTPASQFVDRFLNPIFSAVGAIVLMLLLVNVANRRTKIPGRLQMAVELVMGGLYGLFQQVLGDNARKYTPYLGTLFLFILFNNLGGIVPLGHSSTSAINTTLALGICTFIFVQGIALKENGIGGYLFHMAGSPHSGAEWGMVPLMFILHLVGEFIKPVSLSLRLFGNIFGEDTLIATMVMLGVGLVNFILHAFGAGFDTLVGIPFQVPFLFLALMTSTIQALVFTLLSTIYIALMLPHEHEDHGGEAHGH